MALGTNGGQPCADGSEMAQGVHLRWSLRPELGFPAQGYQVWRRRHRPPEWVCLTIDASTVPAGGAVEWSVRRFHVTVDPGPVSIEPDGCGKIPALYFPGLRTVQVRAPARGVAMRAAGMGTPPLVEVAAENAGETVLVWRGTATGTPSGGWGVTVWGAGIVVVRFLGTDIRLCAVCFGDDDALSGWTHLHGPILLPVVPEGTSNDPAFIHAEAATERLAGRRLSSTLPADTRRDMAALFARDIGDLAGSLLREGPNVRLPEQADESVTRRTPPALGMPAANLIALAALDPNIARMLGLYHHDPVEEGSWDYKVVARYGDLRYPGRRVVFDTLPPGEVGSPTLSHGGITFVGNQGLEVLPPGQSRDAVLRVEMPRIGTVAGMYFDAAVPAVSLRLTGTGFIFFTAWRGSQPVASQAFVTAGLLEDEHGIDAITWTGGPTDFVEVELRPRHGPVGDLDAFAWDLAPMRPAPVRVLALAVPVPAAEPARTNADGTVSRSGSVVLNWADPDGVADVARPVRVHVARASRGDGETPGPGDGFTLRNAERPAPAFARSTPVADAPRPDVRRCWTDRDLRPGWYAWRVRGIDLFGRLGPWSAEREVEVRPPVQPPPPDHVSARYLDPADPYLSDEDRARVKSDGPGLLIEWRWPANRRLSAPQIEPGGEFRVYVRRGDPNLVQGNAHRVTHNLHVSRLETTLAWTGAADALAGERLRIRGASFPIVANGPGPDPWIDVAPLHAPSQRPAVGACAIALSESGPAYTELAAPRAFDRRVHAETVGTLPRQTTAVVSVTPEAGHATVRLADPLPPGMTRDAECLVQDGIVFPVLSVGPRPADVIVQQVMQVDEVMISPVASRPCTLWAGGRYLAWLPGLRLEPAAHEALALALVAVTTADGDARVEDDPRWNRPGRGGLGGRSGREGRASRVARIQVPHRSPPPAPVAPRPPEVDGDIPADRADPADWYGRARYTLAFDRVAGAMAYRVLRASVAALCTRDRAQRQARSGPYASGPFDDGGASEQWLFEHFPSLTAGDLTADLATHPNAATIVTAWRGWIAWYYPRLLNKEVMALAERDGNDEAFMPAHEGTLDAPPYRDTIDGRGLGRFVYRVRAVDASGNAGPWSGAFPLVEVRDVTPPKTPTVVSATASDNSAYVAWLSGGESDLQEYRVWRAEDPDALVDVRRVAPSAVLPAAAATPTCVHADRGLEGLKTWYYRVAAVDTVGNVSPPTPVVAVRVPDSIAPDPPAWERAEWVLVDGQGHEFPVGDPDAIARGGTATVMLVWIAAEAGLTAAVQRRLRGERTWRTIASGLTPIDRADPQADAARRFGYLDMSAKPGARTEYRIRLTDPAGNSNLRFTNPIVVDAP